MLEKIELELIFREGISSEKIRYLKNVLAKIEHSKNIDFAKQYLLEYLDEEVKNSDYYKRIIQKQVPNKQD